MDYQQQDSQEFLRFLLDGMSEDLLRRQPVNKSNSNNSSPAAKTNPNSSPTILPMLPQSSHSSPTSALKGTPTSLLTHDELFDGEGSTSSLIVEIHSPTHAMVSPAPSGRMSTVQRIRAEARSQSNETNALALHSHSNRGFNEPENNSNNTNSIHNTQSMTNSSRLRLVNEINMARRITEGDNNSNSEAHDHHHDHYNHPHQTSDAHCPSSPPLISPIKEGRRLRQVTTNEATEDAANALNSQLEATSIASDEVSSDKVNPATKVTPKDSSKEADQAWERYLDLNDSIITDIFAGQLQSTIQCLTCNSSSSSFDPFLDLSVPIPISTPSKGLLGSIRNSMSGAESNKTASTLEKCLSKFTGKGCDLF